MMDPLLSETCWRTFKYFIILIVCTCYIIVYKLYNGIFIFLSNTFRPALNMLLRIIVVYLYIFLDMINGRKVQHINKLVYVTCIMVTECFDLMWLAIFRAIA